MIHTKDTPSPKIKKQTCPTCKHSFFPSIINGKLAQPQKCRNPKCDVVSFYAVEANE